MSLLDEILNLIRYFSINLKYIFLGKRIIKEFVIYKRNKYN